MNQIIPEIGNSDQNQRALAIALHAALVSEGLLAEAGLLLKGMRAGQLKLGFSDADFQLSLRLEAAGYPTRTNSRTCILYVVFPRPPSQARICNNTPSL